MKSTGRADVTFDYAPPAGSTVNAVELMAVQPLGDRFLRIASVFYRAASTSDRRFLFQLLDLSSGVPVILSQTAYELPRPGSLAANTRLLRVVMFDQTRGLCVYSHQDGSNGNESFVVIPFHLVGNQVILEPSVPIGTPDGSVRYVTPVNADPGSLRASLYVYEDFWLFTRGDQWGLVARCNEYTSANPTAANIREVGGLHNATLDPATGGSNISFGNWYYLTPGNGPNQPSPYRDTGLAFDNAGASILVGSYREPFGSYSDIATEVYSINWAAPSLARVFSLRRASPTSIATFENEAWVGSGKLIFFGYLNGNYYVASGLGILDLSSLAFTVVPDNWAAVIGEPQALDGHGGGRTPPTLTERGKLHVQGPLARDPNGFLEYVSAEVGLDGVVDPQYGKWIPPGDNSLRPNDFPSEGYRGSENYASGQWLVVIHSYTSYKQVMQLFNNDSPEIIPAGGRTWFRKAR